MQILEGRLGRPLEDLLRERYERDGRTVAEVADELGVDKGTVSRWMRDLGIEARLFGPRRTAA
jgi:transposase-like protein